MILKEQVFEPLKILNKSLFLLMIITLLSISVSTVFADESVMTLKSFIELEKKSNQGLVITEKDVPLKEGYYYLTLDNANTVEKVVIIEIGKDFKSSRFIEIKKTTAISQRDIFPLNTFANGIEIHKNSSYKILIYQTKQAVTNPTLKPYTKRTSAMKAEDLYTWSSSYTDSTLVSVTNNGAVYVNMAKYAPEIVSFSQVTTPLNRTHTILDDEDIVIQRKDYADILIKVNAELMKSGYRLLIYDGYRSKESTSALYQYTLNDLNKKASEREYPEIFSSNLGWYVVSPTSKNDRHGKGTAADVSLVDMKTGEIINMPTRVNTMNREAWIDKTRAGSKAYEYLYQAMKKCGAKPYEREWYHFSYIAPREFSFPTKNLRESFYPSGVMNTKPSSWAVAGIDELKNKKIIDPSTISDYKKAITRKEFLTVAMALVDSAKKGTVEGELISFYDAPFNSILRARQLGFINGYNNYFEPNKVVTREESAVILASIIRILTGNESLMESNSEMSFDNASPWALPSIRFLSELNVISSSFSPKDYLTVQEALVLISNAKKSTEVIVTVKADNGEASVND